MSISHMNNTYTKKQETFTGLSKIIGTQSVKAFLKKTKKIGEVSLVKRGNITNNFEDTICKVSLVEFKFAKKDERKTKFFYSLFENGYENAKGLDELDARELGIVEFKYKSFDSLDGIPLDEFEPQSLHAVRSVYNEAIKIINLVSYEGDKYKGIGTKLIDLVVQKSKELGIGGKVFLYAQNLFDPIYLKKSAYCNMQSTKIPTEFYDKYGFSAGAVFDEKFKKKEFIDCIIMHLPFKNIGKILNRINSSGDSVKLS